MRIALADDSALFREGLAMIMDAAGIVVTFQARTGQELLEHVLKEPPDAVLLDIRMPPTFTDEGVRTAQQVRQQLPAVGVLVLSTFVETALAMRLLRVSSGGVGYLLKDRVEDVGTLKDALNRIVSGESVVDPEIVVRLLQRQRISDELGRLTPREREVLSLMAEGRSNVGIARHLYLSPKTVESNAARIFAKLGLEEAPIDNRRVLAVLSWLRTEGVE